MIDLSGKVFVVTGGNGGIGLGMAEGIAMAGGSLAIWETATGRCVNVYSRIQGGAGWPDYGGCIQWSRDDLRVGLAFDTNGVGYVDPFGNTPEVQNFVYATDGLSRPPGWCWAPDSARVFVSCWGWRESSLAGAIGAPSVQAQWRGRTVG